MKKQYFIVMENTPDGASTPKLIIKTSREDVAKKVAQSNDMPCGDPMNSIWYLQKVECVESSM